MSELTLTADKRKELTKSATRRIRRQGDVPAVLYGGEENIPLTVNKKELCHVLKLQSQGNRVFILKIKGDNGSYSERQIMVKELQCHPVTAQLSHVDFVEIAMNKKIVVRVPIKTAGNAPGAKKGAIFNYLLREIEIECLPDNIPQSITIDVSNLEAGHAVHIKDIKVDEKIKILEDPDGTALTLVLPHDEEAEPAEKVVEESDTDEKKESA